MNDSWAVNAAALRGALWGVVLVLIATLLWPSAPEQATARVYVARHHVEQLRATRAAAHQASEDAHAASEATKPAVDRGRAQVLVVAPGVLEVRDPLGVAPPRQLRDSVVAAALEAERARVDRLTAENGLLRVELAIADEQIAAGAELAAALEQQLKTERRASRWRRVGDVVKGVAIGAGALTVYLLAH